MVTEREEAGIGFPAADTRFKCRCQWLQHAEEWTGAPEREGFSESCTILSRIHLVKARRKCKELKTKTRYFIFKLTIIFLKSRFCNLKSSFGAHFGDRRGTPQPTMAIGHCAWFCILVLQQQGKEYLACIVLCNVLLLNFLLHSLWSIFFSVSLTLKEVDHQGTQQYL